jgi:circadian clock protein KaiC
MDIVPTHVAGLDEALGGGIPEGSVVLLCGSPGTMKTSLAFSVLYHNSKEGRRGLYITLEESGEDLSAAMQRMGMGDFQESELYLLDMGKIRLELSEGEVDRDWLSIFKGIVAEAVSASSYSLLALDSLDALYTLETVMDPRRQLFHLFGFLKELGMTALLISEVPFGSQRLTDHGIDFLADGIILLKQLEVGDSDVQLRLRCVKMRKARHDRGYFTLDFDSGQFMATKAIVD